MRHKFSALSRPIARTVLLAALLAGATTNACTVPVFRYALERWPPDPHVVSVTSNAAVEVRSAAHAHNANLWVESAPQGQTSDVVVFHADADTTWYEGPWQPGLLSRLADSPLRRRIAHELLTGTTATFVLIESDNSATNDAIQAMLDETLATLMKKVTIPEELDYEDEADGWSSPAQGQGFGEVPVQVKFTSHRVSRTDEEETFFLRQITSLDSIFDSPAMPLVAVVFGQGRMILLADTLLIPDVLEELCWFLCEPCSCRVKELNPGIDLLMTVNWEEALYAYPSPVTTTLPDGSEYAIGGTGNVYAAEALDEVVRKPAGSEQNSEARSPANQIACMAVAAGIVAILLIWILRKNS